MASALETLTDTVLRPIAEHVLGIQFNDAMVESLKTELTDRLRGRLGRPVNHDIARALRVAELQATEYLVRAYQRLSGALAKNGELVDLEYEPEKFISGVNEYLDKAFRLRVAVQLTERHHEADPTVVGREIAAGAMGREGPRSNLVAAIEAEIAEQTGWKPQPLPKRFAELLRRGDDANGIPSWLTAFRAFLGEKVKTNPRFRDILHTVLLHRIQAEQQEGQIATRAEIDRQLTAMVEAQRDGFGTLGERLKAVEKQLVDTHRSLDGCLALFGNIETRLTRLVDAASDPEALSDAVQSVLDRAYEHMGVDPFQSTCEVLDEISSQLFGRDAARDRLNRFLLDHDRGVLLVTAPAGVGKSALLAAWSSDIVGSDTEVARNYYSTKRPGGSTRTSMVRSIAGQIYLKFGANALGGGTPGPPEDIAERVSNCLRRDRTAAQLVAVLDSVDEASDRIAPFAGGELGQGCYLIVSARAESGEQPAMLKGWRELARKRGCPFEELVLEPLDRDGIEAWLSHEADDPTRVNDTIVERVWQTSEGIPLFASFVVPDAAAWLRERSGTWVTHEMPDSFVKYASGKLDELRELGSERSGGWSALIVRLFALLAIAKGPIGGSNVDALVDDFVLGDSFIDSRVERWFTIRRAVRETFASFKHPRLANVFRQVLPEHVINGMQLRLVNHCRTTWRARPLFPPSSYALEFLPAHLVELGETAEAAALLCDLDFVISRFALPNPARLITQTVSEALALRAVTQSVGEQLDWWSRLWSSFESPMSEIAELGGFGRTTLPSVLIQLLLDTASDSEVGKAIRWRVGREIAPLVALSRPTSAQIRSDPMSIDHAHANKVNGVRAVFERLVSWGRDGAIRFWSADGERLSGGDDHAHAGDVDGVLAVGERLVSWGGDGAIRFWSADGERLPGGDDHAHAHRFGVHGVVEVGERLVSWGGNGAIGFWSAAGERLPGGDDHAHPGQVRGALAMGERLVIWGPAARSASGRQLASGCLAVMTMLMQAGKAWAACWRWASGWSVGAVTVRFASGLRSESGCTAAMTTHIQADPV